MVSARGSSNLASTHLACRNTGKEPRPWQSISKSCGMCTSRSGGESKQRSVAALILQGAETLQRQIDSYSGRASETSSGLPIYPERYAVDSESGSSKIVKMPELYCSIAHACSLSSSIQQLGSCNTNHPP